jgi:thymidylate kinase
MLIVVTGADAVGKSTLTRALRGYLEAQGSSTKQVDKWDIYDFVAYPECCFLKGSSLKTLRSCISAMPVPARTLFLFWTMLMTMREEHLAGADYVFLDSYWYKHAASERSYGASQALIDAAVASLPRPDLVILLDVEPEEAWRRKAANGFADLVPYECGMDPSMTRESFIAHQSKLRNELLGWSTAQGWQVLPADRPVELVQAQALETIAAVGRLP